LENRTGPDDGSKGSIGSHGSPWSDRLDWLDDDHILCDIGGIGNLVVERDPVDLRCQTKVGVGGGGVQAVFLNRVGNHIGRWHRSEGANHRTVESRMFLADHLTESNGHIK